MICTCLPSVRLILVRLFPRLGSGSKSGRSYGVESHAQSKLSNARGTNEQHHLSDMESGKVHPWQRIGEQLNRKVRSGANMNFRDRVDIMNINQENIPVCGNMCELASNESFGSSIQDAAIWIKVTVIIIHRGLRLDTSRATMPRVAPDLYWKATTFSVFIDCERGYMGLYIVLVIVYSGVSGTRTAKYVQLVRSWICPTSSS